MATTTKNRLPECGLYRAKSALPGHEDRIKAGSLVYFHNHSDSGPSLPSVLAPDHNVQNRWHFHGPAIVIRGVTWAETLEPLLPEGFYTLRRALNFAEGNWPKSAIVQLGYNPDADPIIFLARQRARLAENDLFFPAEGMKLTRDQLSILEPAIVFQEPAEGHTTDHDQH